VLWALSVGWASLSNGSPIRTYLPTYSAFIAPLQHWFQVGRLQLSCPFLVWLLGNSYSVRPSLLIPFGPLFCVASLIRCSLSRLLSSVSRPSTNFSTACARGHTHTQTHTHTHTHTHPRWTHTHAHAYALYLTHRHTRTLFLTHAYPYTPHTHPHSHASLYHTHRQARTLSITHTHPHTRTLSITDSHILARCLFESAVCSHTHAHALYHIQTSAHALYHTQTSAHALHHTQTSTHALYHTHSPTHAYAIYHTHLLARCLFAVCCFLVPDASALADLTAGDDDSDRELAVIRSVDVDFNPAIGLTCT
jgi:hypothetical protein